MPNALLKTTPLLVNVQQQYHLAIHLLNAKEFQLWDSLNVKLMETVRVVKHAFETCAEMPVLNLHLALETHAVLYLIVYHSVL